MLSASGVFYWEKKWIFMIELVAKNNPAEYVTLPLYLSNRLKIQQNASFSLSALLC